MILFVLLLFMLVWSCTRGVFVVYECVSQPAISLEQSCCWICIHVSVFPNQRSALGGLAVGYVFMYLCFPTSNQPCWGDMYVMFVFYVEILYVTILSLI